MIDLILIADPMRMDRRERRVVPLADDAGQLAQREGIEGWSLGRHGQELAPDQPIREGDEIVAINYPAGPLGSLLLYSAISTVIGLGVSYLVGSLFGAEEPSQEGGSATYSWNGIQNTYNQGAAVPILYGTHRVGGQVISLWRSPSGLDDYLFILIALGEGPLTAIGDVTDDADGLGDATDFQDAFTVDRLDLANSPDWSRPWGANGSMFCDLAVAEKGDGAASGYTMRDVGQGSDDAYIEGDFENFTAGSFVGIGINVADVDNHYVARYASSSSIELVERVGGVETVLHTETGLTFPVRVHLRRRDGDLTLRVDGSTVYSAPVSGSLSASDIGIVSTGGAGSQLDDVGGGSFAGGNLPTGIRLEDADLASYRDVTAWVRMGRQDQAAVPGFDQVIQNHPVGITLSPQGEWLTYGVHEPATRVDLNVHFPRGLYRISSAGSISPIAVYMTVHWRGDPEDDWTSIGTVEINSATLTGDPDLEGITSPFTYQIAVSGMTGTNQQVRIIRSQPYGDEAYFDECALADVNEHVGETGQTYAGTALLGLKIKANEQLNTRTPNATTLVKGLKVPTWDGASGTAEAPELGWSFSNNPAWVMAGLLLDRRLGLGNWIRPTDLDWDSFKAFADYCDASLDYYQEALEPAYETDNTQAATAGATQVTLTDATDAAEFPVNTICRVEHEYSNKVTAWLDNGDGTYTLTLSRALQNSYLAGWRLFRLEFDQHVTEKRHAFDAIFDERMPVQDGLIQIARCARAMPVLLGNRIRVRFEHTSTPVQTFTEGNILRDSWEVEYAFDAETTHIQQVEFRDAALEYEPNIERAGVLPSLNARQAPVEKTVELRGITRATHARREAHFLRRAAQLLRKRVRFRAPGQVIACEAGDVIRVIHTRFVNSALSSGRAGGTLDQITLDKAVTLEPATSYKVAVVRPDTGATVEANVTATDGDYAAGDVITTDGAAIDVEGAVYGLGEASTYVTLWRVLRVRMTDPEALVGEIEAIEYDADLYDDTNDGLPICETVLSCGSCGDECAELIGPVTVEVYGHETTCPGCSDCTQTCTGSVQIPFDEIVGDQIRWEDESGRQVIFDCDTEQWSHNILSLAGCTPAVAELGICACVGGTRETHSCEEYLEEGECPPSPGGTWVPLVRITRS